MNKVPEVLETKRLRIRRLRATDAATVFREWAQDPDVTRFLIFKPHASVEESIEFAERCEARWEAGVDFTWIVQLREGDRPIGCIAAHPGREGIAVGYLLAKAHWGSGLMTEAVAKLADWFLAQPEVFRVWAVCDCENMGSARVLEKAGFTLEGTLRRWVVHPNVEASPRDVLCYSMVT